MARESENRKKFSNLQENHWVLSVMFCAFSPTTFFFQLGACQTSE